MARDETIIPPPPRHKQLTKDEQQALADNAFRLDAGIRDGIRRTAKELWALSAFVYEFHEGACWALLGYDTLDEYLAQPDVTMSRTQFFRLSKVYRDLVIVRKIPVAKLEEIDPSKVHEVAPAIVRGDVKAADALADAKELGARDLRDKYRRDTPAPAASNGDDPLDDDPGLGDRAPNDPDAEPIDTVAAMEEWIGALTDDFIEAYGSKVTRRRVEEALRVLSAKGRIMVPLR